MKDLMDSPVAPVSTRHSKNGVGKPKLASGLSSKLADGNNREFFWGCTLTKDSPSSTWSFSDEDDDQDFLEHTLFLKQATLGPACKPEERQIVCLETKTFSGTEVKQPIINMKAGSCDNLLLDLVFQHEVPVTFRLIEGSGPVHLSASQLVELPMDSDDDTDTDPETECTATEDMTEEDDDEDEDEEMTEEADSSDARGKKRSRKGSKASSRGSVKKRGKMESDESTEETEETEETADSDEESESESESEEEVKPKRGRKGSKGKSPAVKRKGKKAGKK